MPRPLNELDRRTFLKGAAGSTAALIVSAAYSRDILAQEADPLLSAYTFLSPGEVPTVEALAEQIWPGDDATVGGRDAGVAFYIDRALSGAYIDLQPIYRIGLDWVDQAANAEYGARFADLDIEQQLAFLETHLGVPEVAAGATPIAATLAATPIVANPVATPIAATPEGGPANLGVEGMPLPGDQGTPAASGQETEGAQNAVETITGAPILAGGSPPEVGDLSGFLEIFLTHTIEGLFADPAYGGNRDKRVWADLKYGGPYYVHTEEHQLSFDAPLDIPIQSIADL
ncbi:MAG TPA: gluconate 2-dehydrogenase subunit 3 family protein [Thermomicrobiales bacterium]|jgi:hypothetical protein|nr:gluconate 2-dehydrogenase subunit 3 family protein [Thermomicrobiales bacterium]